MSDLPIPLTDDFLVRLFRHDIGIYSAAARPGMVDDRRRALMRSPHFDETDLLSFAARFGSVWALEEITARVSDGAWDWASLRAEIVAHGSHPRVLEPTLDRLSLLGLWQITQAASFATEDDAAVKAGTAFIAHRVVAGGDLSTDERESLAAALLRTDQHRLALRLMRALSADSWARRALEAELEHPRFGGSIEAGLNIIGQAYRRENLEPVTVGAGRATPWAGLQSEATEQVRSGPLVSILMAATSPTAHILTAAASIVAQSYQNWELLLVHNGSTDDRSDLLHEAATLDPRVRLVRSERLDEAARLAEALRDDARGDLIALQSDRTWSHPRRIELQLHDLMSRPSVDGNLAGAIWVDHELSFVPGSTVQLFEDEASLMFRRGVDPSRASNVKLVCPDAPLQWKLVADPRCPGFVTRQSRDLDMLVVANLLESPTNISFTARLADELTEATRAGIRVGVLHREAIARPGRRGRLAQRIEALLEEGPLVRVETADAVTTDLVVVRHAGAAQGYPSARISVTADRVVIVEDPSAGDIDGGSFARTDVLDTVTGWFGSSPGWLPVTLAPTAPPSARVASRPNRLPTEDADAPLLSIVMPVYNVARYLEASLISVLYQDFHDFELIVVDDASTDGSRQIADMYAAMDPRIRVIDLAHNTIGGAGIPSNLGIRAARGKYLGFVDSDDIVVRGSFQRLVALAERTDADVVIGGFATFVDGGPDVSEAYDLARTGRIPRDRVISATTHPELLSMSPVPWRKLYRTSFMDKHGIQYPEGDYFYEDNPLHWTVLALADRVVLTDERVSMHRMSREGQTMTSADFRKAAYAHHLTMSLRAVLSTGGARREALMDAFVERLDATRWVVRQQTHAGAKAMLAKRLATLYDRAAAAGARVPAAMRSTVDAYRATYPYYDLTIVVAAHNNVGAVRKTLDSILPSTRTGFDILVVDEGSTDGTLPLLRTYESAHANVHVFTGDRRGVGRARNSVIPLITGRFALFVDAGDVIDPRALSTAVREADRQSADVLFTEYRTSHRKERLPDAAIWKQFASATTEKQRRTLAADLSSHPSNRLVRSAFLQDENIFFGGTAAYENAAFHWQTVVMAEHIAFAPVSVVTRKKSTIRREAARTMDATPEAAWETVRYTDERISSLPSYAALREQWVSFARDLLAAHPEKPPADLWPTSDGEA